MPSSSQPASMSQAWAARTTRFIRFIRATKRRHLGTRQSPSRIKSTTKISTTEMLRDFEVESCAAWSEKRDPGHQQITGKTRANAVSVSPSRDEECFEHNEFERALQVLARGCKSVNKSRASGTQGTQGEPDRAGPHRKDALSTQCCVVGKSALAIDRQ